MIKIIRKTLFLLLLTPVMALAQQTGSDKDGGDAELCSYMISLAEQARKIPTGLLQAIAQVESGRYIAGKTLSKAWPWTVASSGQSSKKGEQFYKTKDDAIKAIETLRDNGLTNIDVGCMQVNLFYHGRGFGSIQEAIEPVNNVAYATEYLSFLFRRYENWGEAVKHYHSADPQKNSYYLEKVIAAWQRLGQERNSPYIRELQAALNKKSIPPLPPSAESEQALAKNTLDFAEELKRRVISIEQGAGEDEEGGSKDYTDELRIWDEWQHVKNLGDIKGKKPSHYIDLLDEIF